MMLEPQLTIPNRNVTQRAADDSAGVPGAKAGYVGTTVRLEHRSVMMQEVVDNLLTNTSGLYVDATYGAGGHSTALLGSLGPKGRVIALDCDQSIRFARTSDPRAAAGHANFRELSWYLRCAEIYGADGIVADLGVSSTQVNDAQRGLSYLHPGPLDMRVDPTRSVPLSGRLRRTELGTLHSSLRCHGLYGRTKAAASRILQIVRQARYTTTLDVATAACCMHTQGMHIAADAFRALRSMANSEPQCLRSLVRNAPAVLKPGGRLLILTFDSYGERLVKASIEHAHSLVLMRTVSPTQREVATNASARSSLQHLRTRDHQAACPQLAHASLMSPSQHHPATVAMIMGTQRVVRAGIMLVLPRLDIEVGMEVYVRTLEPIVASTSVSLRCGYALATVLGHPKCPRVTITKHRRRKHHRSSMTHRQHSTAIVVSQAAYPHDGTEEGRRHNQER